MVRGEKRGKEPNKMKKGNAVSHLHILRYSQTEGRVASDDAVLGVRSVALFSRGVAFITRSWMICYSIFAVRCRFDAIV